MGVTSDDIKEMIEKLGGMKNFNIYRKTLYKELINRIKEKIKEDEELLKDIMKFLEKYKE